MATESPHFEYAVTLLRNLFDAAVESAYPGSELVGLLPEPPRGKTVVVGAGKAGASMAQTLEKSLGSIEDSLIIVPQGHSLKTESINIIEASHPVPDRIGLEGATHILEMARSLKSDDLLLCLLSGGGSALLNLPLPGITLAEKQAITRSLLSSGATINEINTVRKHLSAIKGGRLATASYPASTFTLAVSDVPGNHISTIASGPTVGDPSTCAEADNVLDRFSIAVSPAIRRILRSDQSETPAPGDPALRFSRYEVVAGPGKALEAASNRAQHLGFNVINLGDQVEGLAAEIAKHHAHLIRTEKIFENNQRTLLLSGGEATVQITGAGSGGPNQEYLLALAIELNGHENLFGIACDTDGIDGATTAAGAVITPSTLSRAAERGINPKDCLENNDAGSFFTLLNDLVTTGPTYTNVNDFRAIAYIPNSD
ncbi:MAG: glycerate kinase [Proteobacteria bacterium]|nr:glycerate kinase [Pseudomonadota bacterium]